MMILTSTHPLYLFVLIIGCLAVLSTTLYLLYQLNYPRILTYPWNLPSAFFQESTTLYDHYTEVVLAGSYNPPHYGHLEMIAYLARRYKKVHVVIGMNPNKVYQVSPHQRADIIERMVQLKLTEECKLKIKVVGTYVRTYAIKWIASHAIKCCMIPLSPPFDHLTVTPRLPLGIMFDRSR